MSQPLWRVNMCHAEETYLLLVVIDVGWRGILDGFPLKEHLAWLVLAFDWGSWRIFVPSRRSVVVVTLEVVGNLGKGGLSDSVCPSIIREWGFGKRYNGMGDELGR